MKRPTPKTDLDRDMLRAIDIDDARDARQATKKRTAGTAA